MTNILLKNYIKIIYNKENSFIRNKIIINIKQKMNGIKKNSFQRNKNKNKKYYNKNKI